MKDSDFIVLLENIPPEGLNRSLVVDDGPALGLETAVPLDGPLAVKLAVTRHGDEILIRGRLEGSVFLECSRCLETYRFPLDVEVETCLQRGGRQPQEEDLELTTEEIDVQLLHQRDIDLREYIAEHIHIGIPVKPLCDEGCLGLCSRCGKDLNGGACTCPKEVPDHRWDALKALKL